ncbi:MAG: heme anaerobic degradation radical SAM methyltransferase ChuW/HutW [Candidatus Sabulitectum sp.]|nr:heme anaerobic degradation radical SAM methyltransferase ChuW/HutW [Candidatus Sabulitectum sp.]
MGNEKIKWTSEVEELIKGAPVFVQPMIRKLVENSARRDGMVEVTKKYVNEVREKSGMGRKINNETKLEEYYAIIGKNPLYAGFHTSNDLIHPGGSGEPIAVDGVWNKMQGISERVSRRALYIHIPFCVARCKFCSFYQSRTNFKELSKYAEYIIKELRLVAESTVGQSMPIHALYFGGGTPTDLSAEDLEMILKYVNSCIPLANDCEITMEGRIHDFTDEKVLACLNNGVNRFSFGIQSFNTGIRQQMGRIDDQEFLLERIARIASYQKAMISVDLIYGLPDQTRKIWLEDLKTVKNAAGIDSVSIYSLKNLPGSPIKEMVSNRKLSPPASITEQADLFTITREYFADENCKRLGLRHWAFSNRERSMYNFIPKYNNSCIPVGNGAGGRLAGYSIYQKMKNSEYFDMLDRGEKPIAAVFRASPYAQFEGDIVGSFEEFRQVNLHNLEIKYGDETIISRLSLLLDQWAKAGMVEWNNKTGVIRMTPAGEFYNVQITQNLINYNAISLRTARGKA